MGPGDGYPGAFGCGFHFQDVDLDTLCRLEDLALHLLILIQGSVHLPQVDADVFPHIPLDDASHHILLLAVILLEQYLPLFLPDFLQDDILGILCGNSAKLL